jgi:hypothetical protein
MSGAILPLPNSPSLRRAQLKLWDNFTFTFYHENDWWLLRQRSDYHKDVCNAGRVLTISEEFSYPVKQNHGIRLRVP